MDHLTLESRCYNQIKVFKLSLRRGVGVIPNRKTGKR